MLEFRLHDEFTRNYNIIAKRSPRREHLAREGIVGSLQAGTRFQICLATSLELCHRYDSYRVVVFAATLTACVESRNEVP